MNLKPFPAAQSLSAAFIFAAVLAVSAQTPLTADAYLKSGQKKELAGDLTGALADFKQVLVLNAGKDQSADTGVLVVNTIAKGSRDYLQLATGDLTFALINFRKDKPTADVGFSSSSCFIWVIQNKKGNKPAADQELAATLTTTAAGFMNDDAAIATAKYFLGRLSEADLLKALRAEDAKTVGGKRQDYLAEGYYFIGEKYLVTGDADTAVKYFYQAQALPSMMARTRNLIHAELKALGRTDAPKSSNP